MANKIFKREVSRRNFIKGAAAGIGGGALVGLGARPVRAQSKVIKWRMQSLYPSNSMTGKFFFRWAKYMTVVTGGRLTVECLEPGAIVAASEAFQSASKGTVDAVGSYGAFHRGIMPEIDVEQGLPLAWETPQEAHDAYYNLGLLEEIRKVYAEHNLFFVGPCYANVIYGYPTVKPVRKPSDFRGLKMRDLGLSADWLAHFGASPTVIAAPEMYMALKMGTVDGVHFGTAALEDYKLGEVCKYYLLEPKTGNAVNDIYINLKAYTALPDDLKNIVKDYSQTFTLPVTLEWDEQRSWIESSRKYGVEGIRWSKEDMAMAREHMIKVLWKKVADKSPRCKKLVDIITDQAKHLAKI